MSSLNYNSTSVKYRASTKNKKQNKQKNIVSILKIYQAWPSRAAQGYHWQFIKTLTQNKNKILFLKKMVLVL